MTDKLLTALEAIYNRLGDVRTKNALLLLLALMNLFGIVAPATATALRDTVLSLVF